MAILDGITRNRLRAEAEGDTIVPISTRSLRTQSGARRRPRRAPRRTVVRWLVIGWTLVIVMLWLVGGLGAALPQIAFTGLTFGAWQLMQRRPAPLPSMTWGTREPYHDAILIAGAEGEEKTLEELSGLPDSYHVFNQVDLPNARSVTGVNEADLIVAGPNGVFVLEVKHNTGVVTGSDADMEWTVTKSGRRGIVHEKTLRNPVSQVTRLVRLLISQLARDRRPWVQGIVVFSHPSVTLDIEILGQVPCLRLGQVRDYILAFESRGASGLHALGTLQRLKHGDFEGADTQRVQVSS